MLIGRIASPKSVHIQLKVHIARLQINISCYFINADEHSEYISLFLYLYLHTDTVFFKSRKLLGSLFFIFQEKENETSEVLPTI